MITDFWTNLIGRESLIAADDTFGLLCIMCLSVFLAIYLEQTYRWASKISGCMIALLLAMLLANFGILPLHSVLYDDIVWGVIVPLGIPLLLLQCNLKKIWGETGRMLIIFVIGAVGTTVGAFLAFFLLKGVYGNATDLARVASMMTGTYIGGSVNFAAMASQFAAADELVAAATVADNFVMAAYFFALIAIAGSAFFRKHYPHPLIEKLEASGVQDADQTSAASFWARKDISLKDIALNLCYAATIVWISRMVSGIFSGLSGDGILMAFVTRFFGSQYVWITTFSVLVATFASKKIEDLHGSQEIGTYMIYLFLFVIGVPANIFTVITKSPLMLVVTSLMVFMNMIFCFLGAKLFRFHLEDAIIASNANIGGPTTAAGMAIAQGWTELVGPAMLIGTMGYVLGNYIGTIVGIALGL